MPVMQGRDGKGSFYQWGMTGKRYYFTTPLGRNIALHRALTQARAIKARQNKRKFI